MKKPVNVLPKNGPLVVRAVDEGRGFERPTLMDRRI